MSHPSNKKERFDIGKRKGKNRGEQYFRNCNDIPEEFQEKNNKLRRDTTKLCSCPLCGNPRKYFDEKTPQERKFEEQYNLIDKTY